MQISCYKIRKERQREKWRLKPQVAQFFEGKTPLFELTTVFEWKHSSMNETLVVTPNKGQSISSKIWSNKEISELLLFGIFHNWYEIRDFFGPNQKKNCSLRIFQRLI